MRRFPNKRCLRPDCGSLRLWHLGHLPAAPALRYGRSDLDRCAVPCCSWPPIPGLVGCLSRSDCPNRIHFSHYWTHPLFVPGSIVPLVGLANDIAVLRLATPFTAGSYPRNVRPVCLPSAGLPVLGLHPLSVAGWGIGLTLSTTDELRKVFSSDSFAFPSLFKTSAILVQAEMITMPFPTCNLYFQKLDFSSFCATPVEIGTTCQGDSGSGIVSDRGGRSEIDGVVSYGLAPPLGCAPLPGVFSGYQQVFIHLNWIRFVMGG